MFSQYSDIVRIGELCEMLRIGRNKAYQLLRSGRVSGFKDGRLWMIPKQSVINYITNYKEL